MRCEVDMRRVSGRIVLSGTDLGIPRLLVTVYDANLAISSPSAAGMPPGHETDESRSTRRGSVITDNQGTFVLEYDRADRQTEENSHRPDRVLVISNPEERCSPGHEAPARIAACVRRAAGDIESFVITLDKSHLKDAGVHPPGDDKDVEDEIERQKIAARRQARQRTESQRRFVESLQKRRQLARLAEPKFDRFLAVLSSAPRNGSQSAGRRYVTHGASVYAVSQAAMQSDIRERINRASVAGAVALSEEEASRFRDETGRFVVPIPASAIEPYLRPKHSGRSPGRVRAVPRSRMCHEGPVDPCEEILQGKAPAEPPPNGSRLPPEILLKADIPLLVENLVQHMRPPESATIFSVHNRAGVEEIQKDINGFTLHSGPADGPSLHDFHHLQIAFEHVWQDLLDEKLIETGKQLYTSLVELGEDPNEYLIDPANNDITTAVAMELGTGFAAAANETAAEPPPEVVKAFEITREQWSALSPYHQELKDLADELIIPIGETFWNAENREKWLPWKKEHLANKRRQGERIIQYAKHALESNVDQFHQLLAALSAALKEPYRFSIYAANPSERSVNFGVVATYRQRWEPVSYQVGELVKTVPLAPKEIRRFTKKVSIRKSRAEKEVENNLQARKTERAETARAETEIIQKALSKTNFQLSAEAGGGVGFVHGKGSTAFAHDAATDSQEVKKEFREAVFKAAEEFKSERTMEINVSTGEETTFEESGEIANPNDEIPVTYLFYELQRRYRVTEQIHSVMPVVLVAQEFPKPSDIDDDWILAHDWILRRVILDDSFLPAMNYLGTAVVGDEVSLRELYINLQQQRRIAEELKEELVAIREQVGRRYADLQKSIELRADVIEADEGMGLPVPMPVGFVFTGNDVSPEAAKVREDAARDAFERKAKQEKEVQGRLERETTALNALTETYTKALSEHLNRRTQIGRLQVHIKSNIMYYMQAIWSHEPDDQRFFRLHEVRVPKLQGETTYSFEADPDAIPMPPDGQTPLKLVVKCEIDPNLEFETLEQVADLDNLLGFKGNYMMFPLKKSNVLTDFMMIPYMDGVMAIRDPDPLGNWTLSDFIKYVCCLRHQLSQAEFDRFLPGLQATYQRLVNAATTDGEEIIVPTDSLFIEALPGVHPILEDFKLFQSDSEPRHRVGCERDRGKAGL